MKPMTHEPDVRGTWRNLVRTRWVILLFHALFAVWWLQADRNVQGVMVIWLLLQLGIHAGYHRYFAHGSFKTYPWVEFLMACVGCLAFQNGPLWWASKHRQHHRFADTNDDPHSPSHGFWHAHIGWLWREDDEINRLDWQAIPDLCRPVPIWVERHQGGIYFFYGALVVIMFGWSSLLTFWIVPVVLCWHTTFATNSICHLRHADQFASHPGGSCMARNNAIVAMANLGEGWHKNHHTHPARCNHGFYKWYQVDVIYLVLLLLKKLNIVWNIKI